MISLYKSLKWQDMWGLRSTLKPKLKPQALREPCKRVRGLPSFSGLRCKA